MQYLLDSYAWLEYFGGNKSYSAYVEQGVPYTSASALAEIVRSLKRKGHKRSDIMRAVEFVCGKSIVLPLEKEDAIRAGFLAEETGLHYADALVYAFASSQRRVVTGDKDFEKLENVEFVQ